VPLSLKVDDDFPLGNLVGNCRQNKDSLSQYIKDSLDKLDFVWDPLQFKWDKAYEHLKKFYKENGHSIVNSNFNTKDKFPLGKWVNKQRSNKDSMSKERKKRLNKLDFVWNPIDATWERGYGELKKFYEKNGHSVVPQLFETKDGLKLGAWVTRQRGRKDSMSKERKDKLEKLDFVWNTVDAAWERGYGELKNFYEKNGHSDVKGSFQTKDGYNLGTWVENIKQRKDILSQKKKDRLEKLKLNLSLDIKEQNWNEWYEQLKIFYENNGHSKVKKVFKTNDGYRLGGWVSKQRGKKDSMSKERKDKLDKLDFVW